MRHIRLLIMTLGVLLSTPALANPTFVPPQGRPLLDAANIIDDADEKRINTKLLDIRDKSKHQVMVLTTPSLEGLPISEYGLKAARYYKIGDRDSSDGVFITIAPNEKKSRIDVGRGMDVLLTDALSREIVQDVMIPQFKNKQWTGGIEAGLDRLASIITPLTEEQIAIQKRAEAARALRLQNQKDAVAEFLLWFLGVFGTTALAFWTYWLATSKKRKAAKLLSERKEEEAQALRLKIANDVMRRQREERERLRTSSPQTSHRNGNAPLLKTSSAVHKPKQTSTPAPKPTQHHETRRQDDYVPVFIPSSVTKSDDKYRRPTSNDSPSSTIGDFFGGGGDFGGAGAEGSWD